jgi:hypothetical protein
LTALLTRLALTAALLTTLMAAAPPWLLTGLARLSAALLATLVWFVCLVCLFGLFVWFVCLVCLFGLFVWFVCLVCLFGLFVWFICLLLGLPRNGNFRIYAVFHHFLRPGLRQMTHIDK